MSACPGIRLFGTIGGILMLLLALCSSGRASIRRRPPNLDCSVQELFGRWLRASGGEQAWKGLWDISMDLVSKQTLGDLEVSSVTRTVRFRIQPRLRARIVFVDPADGLRTLWGLDSKGWFLYKERVPVAMQPLPWYRQPEVLCDPKTRDDVSYEIKATAFWLGLPFTVQVPGTRLRFAGWLDSGSSTSPPLPMLEVDLTEVAESWDWPIDQVTVALRPDTWLAAEASFRFVGDEVADWTCLFRRYTKTGALIYPRVRIFYKESDPGERVEIMERVRLNRWLPESFYERPAWLERAGRIPEED